MPDLKLLVFDADDLKVMSAHLQDAVLRVADMAYLPLEKRFALVANRFDWEAHGKAQTAGDGASGPKAAARRALGGPPKAGLERRRTGVRFERVLAASLQGFDPKDGKHTLALLAIEFTPSAEPGAVGGDVTLTFSGQAAIRLSVECLEAALSDLGAVWSARHAPKHGDDV